MALPFHLAHPLILATAKAKGITTQEQWRTCRDPDFPPEGLTRNLDATYKGKGWVSWGHALGTERLSTQHKRASFLPVEEASAWLQAAGVWSSEEFERRCRDKNEPDFPPPFIPRNPADSYGELFPGWPVFLNMSANQRRSRIEAIFQHVLESIFNEATLTSREASVYGASGEKYRVDVFLSSIGLVVEYDGGHYHKNRYHRDTEKTQDLVDHGYRVIRLRGKSLSLIQSDWDLPIDEAQAAPQQVQALLEHLLSLSEKGHLFLPPGTVPEIQAWIHEKLESIDFYEVIKSQEILPMLQAQAWAKEQGIDSQKKWYEFFQDTSNERPAGIPLNPADAYGEAFVNAGGWGWWLGTGRVSNHQKRQRWVTLEEFMAWAHALSDPIQSRSHFEQLCKQPGWRPDNIPSDPKAVYGKEAIASIGGLAYLWSPNPPGSILSRFKQQASRGQKTLTA